MGLERINEDMVQRATYNSRKHGIINNPGILSTGYVDLDYMLGGLRPGEVYLLAGRPRMGTTSFALNLIRHLSIHGKDGNRGIAYFSLDQGKAQIIKMLLQIVAKAEYQDVYINDGDSKKMETGKLVLSESGLYIEDTPRMSPIEIITSLISIPDYANAIDLIVIDYLELLDIEDEIELEKTIKCLKAFAESAGCSVLLLSRLEETPELRENHIPIMEDLKWPSLERMVDHVIFLYRDDVYDRDSEMKGITEFIIARSKYASSGVVRLAWLPEYLRFCNLDQADLAENAEKNSDKET